MMDSAQPPLLLLGVSLLIGLLESGVFVINLQNVVDRWRQDSLTVSQGQVAALLTPFLTAAIAIAVFLAGCLQTVGIPPVAAFRISAAIVVVGTGFLWRLLNRYLTPLLR